MILCCVVASARIGNTVIALGSDTTSRESIRYGLGSIRRDLRLNGVDVPRPTASPLDNKEGTADGAIDHSDINNHTAETMDAQSSTNNFTGLIYATVALMTLICCAPWMQKSCFGGNHDQNISGDNGAQPADGRSNGGVVAASTPSQSNMLANTIATDDQPITQREQLLEARRQERRAFYLSYIEPYTMVRAIHHLLAIWQHKVERLFRK